MKLYEKPELEVIQLLGTDIVCDSNMSGGGGITDGSDGEGGTDWGDGDGFDFGDLS